MGTDRRSRLWLRVVLSATVATFVGTLLAVPAAAAPSDDSEGGTNALREQLEVANRGFLEAQAAVEASRVRQTDLNAKVEQAKQRLGELAVSANEIAAYAYRNNNLRTASALLGSLSPENFVDRATAINALALTNDRSLREYIRLQRELEEAKAKVDDEVRLQEQQLAEMDRRRKDAERALGNSQKTTGFASADSAAAVPAPKVNGKWPTETCSVDDPTTSGCLTPRTLHAYNQARTAGYTRYTACHRSASSGEHPKGRACDFSAASSGFANVDASGGDRTYGNNLAAYFVKNASALAVLYVIWYRQIWQPSIGWKAYSGGNGDPASDHTNHVHLSII